MGSVDIGPAGPGFVFGEADSAGDFHEDMLFTLNGSGAPDGLAPGAYGLWLTLTSPDYAALCRETSDVLGEAITLGGGVDDDH